MKALIKKIDKQILLRNTIILIFTLAIFIGIDQFTKIILFSKWKNFDEIGNEQGVFATGGTFIGTRLVTNTGMFSSLGDTMPYWSIQLITSLVATIVMIPSLFVKNPWTSFGFALLSAGALGNIMDRYLLIDSNGGHYVRDWIYHPNFDRGTYNLADIEVVIGSIVTALSIIFELFKSDETKKKKINKNRKLNK